MIEHFDLHVELEPHRNCILNGTIPSTIGNWNGPITIDWSGHALSGTLPDSMMNWKVHRLQKFQMNSNEMEGSIPSFVVTWLNLTHIEMNYNHITGTIPEQIGNMYQLREFEFQGNQLHGTLPSSLQNLSQMEIFSVGENMLTGTIPNGIASTWTNLRYAAFYQNPLDDNTISETICTEWNHTAPADYIYKNNESYTATFSLWIEIDCNNTAVEDRCSCCDCVL